MPAGAEAPCLTGGVLAQGAHHGAKLLGGDGACAEEGRREAGGGQVEGGARGRALKTPGARPFPPAKAPSPARAPRQPAPATPGAKGTAGCRKFRGGGRKRGPRARWGRLGASFATLRGSRLRARLTIAVAVEQGERLLELGDLLLGQGICGQGGRGNGRGGGALEQGNAGGRVVAQRLAKIEVVTQADPPKMAPRRQARSEDPVQPLRQQNPPPCACLGRSRAASPAMVLVRCGRVPGAELSAGRGVRVALMTRKHRRQRAKPCRQPRGLDASGTQLAALQARRPPS